MPIYSGTNEIKYIYSGTNIVSRVYLGSTLIWGGYPVFKSMNYAWSSDNFLRYVAGSSNSSYAIFGGGTGSSFDVSSNQTIAFNSSLVASSPATLPEAIFNMKTATAGTAYALFGGGRNSTEYKRAVYSYDTSLTRSTLSNLRLWNANRGESFNGYAVFVGGVNSSSAPRGYVDYYNSSLSKGTATSMSSDRGAVGVANNGTHLIIAGGSISDVPSATVDVYNTSFSRLTPLTLKDPIRRAGGTRIKDCAVFSGGYSDNVYDATFAYNKSLVRTDIESRGVSRKNISACSLEGTPNSFGIFSNELGFASYLNVINQDFVFTIFNVAGTEIYSMASIGNKVIMQTWDETNTFFYATLE